MHIVIATDLDRTLLPNGKQAYDNSIPIFNDIIKREKLTLIYATGRNINQLNDAVKKYHLLMPDYFIAEVGTRLYTKKGNKLVEDKDWLKTIDTMTPNWNIDIFKQELSVINGLRLQEPENQNKFKLSYYIDDLSNAETIVRAVTKIIKAICPSDDAVKACCTESAIVYSVDELHNIGLLDILPRGATKLTTLEYLRKKLGLKKRQIIYCGDSGNDILPLTSGYRAIMVRNARAEVKKAVEELAIKNNNLDNLYISKGYKKLNGYYVSGIIEGLINFNVVSEDYLG